MGAPAPEDRSRGCEIPIVLHEAAEFDVASEQGYNGGAAAGEWTRREHLHPPAQFDCSEPVGNVGAALRVTFHLPAGEAEPSLASEVVELIHALHEYDKALGGRGLGLDRSASRAVGGRLSLVLRPNQPQGAVDRFRRIAEQLGSPLTRGLPDASTGAAPNGVLADVASRWEGAQRQPTDGATGTPDLTTPLDRVRGYQVEFVLVPVA